MHLDTCLGRAGLRRRTIRGRKGEAPIGGLERWRQGYTSHRPGGQGDPDDVSGRRSSTGGEGSAREREGARETQARGGNAGVLIRQAVTSFQVFHRGSCWPMRVRAWGKNGRASPGSCLPGSCCCSSRPQLATRAALPGLLLPLPAARGTSRWPGSYKNRAGRPSSSFPPQISVPPSYTTHTLTQTCNSLPSLWPLLPPSLLSLT